MCFANHFRAFRSDHLKKKIFVGDFFLEPSLQQPTGQPKKDQCRNKRSITPQQAFNYSMNDICYGMSLNSFKDVFC